MQHLTQSELAERWRLSPRTLERWRQTGFGPRFIKLGSRCLYPLEEIERFERASLHQRSPRGSLEVFS